MQTWQARDKTARATGATSGIGLNLAEILARSGYDLVIIARREAELEAIVGRLNQQHGVKVETIAANLSEAGDTDNRKQAGRGGDSGD